MKRLLAFLGGLMICVTLTPGLILAQEIIWNRTFTLEYPDWDCAYSAQQTSDGGYILSGETSYSKTHAAWLLKTDSEGQKEWERTFEGSGHDTVNRAQSVQQTSDGGYITAGFTVPPDQSLQWKAWIIKTDSKGQEEWKRIFDEPMNDKVESVQQTTDGGYILGGFTSGVGWLLKTDSEGQKEWKSTFGDGLIYAGDGAVHQNCWPRSVQQTTDGGYILAGISFSSQNSYYSWLVKTDSNGQKEWERIFSDGGLRSSANFVQQTTDGGYILAGRKGRGITTWDTWLVKTDYEGQKEWDRTFGDEEARLGATSVKQTLDGGYILASYREYRKPTVNLYNNFHDAVIIKTDSEGQKEWDKIFSRENGSFYPHSLLATSDGDYVVAGYTEHYGTYNCDAIDGWLAKIKGEQLQVSVEENNKPSAFTLSQNFPNPFNPTTEISFGLPTDSQVTLTVFNTLGQRVTTLVDEVKQAGNYQVRWNGTEFPTGIYFYCLETKAHSASSGQGFTKTMKMLLMK